MPHGFWPSGTVHVHDAFVDTNGVVTTILGDMSLTLFAHARSGKYIEEGPKLQHGRHWYWGGPGEGTGHSGAEPVSAPQ